jgi:RAB6A-GEF complex partner protein 1
VLQTNLFLPPILRHYISASDSTTALSLCHHYHDLPYFSHALEVLLHTVLDEEVDNAPNEANSLLASVISFLSSFPDYLDIVVQCTRKTELRSWKTLFAHLPPPEELFNESLRQNELKTAGGYLIILHTLDESNSSSEQAISLLKKAKAAHDWDLCKELARFLMALDQSGEVLLEAMAGMDREPPSPTSLNGILSGPGEQLDQAGSRDASSSETKTLVDLSLRRSISETSSVQDETTAE